jgi:signal peptidase
VVLRAARVMFRVVGWLATLAAVLVLLAVIVVFLGPRLSGWNLRVILSGSMEPALPVGSLVLVEPKAPEEVKVGDILTFRSPSDADQQVTHRVVEIRGEGSALHFETKGDANEALDRYPVPAGEVVGTVRWHVPQLGYLVERVGTGRGFILLVLIPGVIIICGEVWNIVNAVRRERRNRRPRVGQQEALGEVQMGGIMTFRSSSDPDGQVTRRVVENLGEGSARSFESKGQGLILLVLILTVVIVGAFIISGGLGNVMSTARSERRNRPRVRQEKGG